MAKDNDLTDGVDDQQTRFVMSGRKSAIYRKPTTVQSRRTEDTDFPASCPPLASVASVVSRRCHALPWAQSSKGSVATMLARRRQRANSSCRRRLRRTRHIVSTSRSWRRCLPARGCDSARRRTSPIRAASRESPAGRTLPTAYLSRPEGGRLNTIQDAIVISAAGSRRVWYCAPISPADLDQRLRAAR